MKSFYLKPLDPNINVFWISWNYQSKFKHLEAPDVFLVPVAAPLCFYKKGLRTLHEKPVRRSASVSRNFRQTKTGERKRKEKKYFQRIKIKLWWQFTCRWQRAGLQVAGGGRQGLPARWTPTDEVGLVHPGDCGRLGDAGQGAGFSQ